MPLFGAVAAVELVGVALDSTATQWLAKPLLAPLLLAYLWSVRRRIDGVAVGLVFATAGDVALLLEGQPAFLAGMGCFLVTQLAFLTSFVRHRRPPAPAVLGYVAVWAVANALLWGALGPLRLPVLGYSLALSLMAAAATGVSRRVAVGGALFLGSDLLIGLEAAGVHLAGHGLLVMASYIAALLLITTAWAAALTTGDRHPSPVAPALT
ncbi:lysoplasmalogenase [Micromonospora sp. CB01531]|uniref:lysoplasmalogenase n=1 Tax=Micromonospora sp. CB01531 TaxID=1718947 RepID=UPI000A4A714C|nr:lysoplasmalogenase [Micromonospora sp. CB01531]